MGIINENEVEVKKIKMQLQNNFISTKFLFYKFNFVFDTCKLLRNALGIEFFDNLSIYYKLNKILYYYGIKLPLHH
jgi:hypothetical protein